MLIVNKTAIEKIAELIRFIIYSRNKILTENIKLFVDFFATAGFDAEKTL